ncbi:CRISPR-associated helicase Cas3' [Spirochaetia bacterium 38H-sp]|uniref:CRISPR-associated helicase Cas3 n=1 Tax=Rarispira pelagica TaxID=3141764 RepID=A0ABU9UBF2_9SPIR
MPTFFAKSTGETIDEHTKKLLIAFDILSNYAKLTDEDKFIIIKLISYHDLGKKNPEFQNRMRKKLGLNERFDWNRGNVPHEWLSPAFITQQEEKEIKNKLQLMGLDIDRFFNYFIFCILSHHNRENQIPDNGLICSVVDWMNSNFQLCLEYYYDVFRLLSTYNTSENRNIWNLFFPYRVKWLGSLIKSDYSASAGIDPETPYSGSYHAQFNNFLRKKGFNLRDFQKEAKKSSEKSIILVASTGMGKTEAAINWINGQKAFYLLGIRTAVNAMYNRFKNIFGDNVTLLHGESSYFFAQEENNEYDYDIRIEKARKLSYPLTIATADQIITSVFKYPGFELTYLTCTYSKVVMDEIQSFSPASIAAIVVFLKEIHNLGGKFMLMTATLPPFLMEELKDIGNIEIFKPQLLKINRHRIKIVEEDICMEGTLELIKNFKDKKILVICNTVSKAQKVFKMLKETGGYDASLIHARFINKDRKKKEYEIIKANSPCIWISTQVVEASLDIDFDILLTENASIESLFQRFGRCYRKREYQEELPNVYIFSSTPSMIYDEYLFNKTWDILKEDYNEKVITENDKQEIINKIFYDIKNTNYWKNYKKQKDLLEIGYRSLSRIQAESDFRDITNNYLIIPNPVYENNKEIIDCLLQFIDDRSKNRMERIKKQAEFMNYTMPMQIFNKQVKNLEDINKSIFCRKHNIKIMKNVEYTYELGLVIEQLQAEENDNII